MAADATLNWQSVVGPSFGRPNVRLSCFPILLSEKNHGVAASGRNIEIMTGRGIDRG
jgi:hypothetical protein